MNDKKNKLLDKLSNTTNVAKNVVKKTEVRKSAKELVKVLFKGVKDITDTFDVNKRSR